MADLLTHVLVAYTVAIVLSWKFKWINSAHVTAVMVGSTLPDLTRIGLLIDPASVENIGIPFSYSPLHTMGGAMVSVLIISTLVRVKHAKITFILLTLGLLSHLALDSLIISASGHSYAIFWPISVYNPPTPGLYLSTDMWPALLAGSSALCVWLIDSRVHSRSQNI